MNKHDRKAEAHKLIKLDNEKAERSSYDEKDTRRAVVNTRADMALVAFHLSQLNLQVRWIKLLLVLILLALIVIAIP
jgi:hypothetical protein